MLKILVFLLIAYSVSCVQCETRYIKADIYQQIDPIHCWDDFGTLLNITGLPDGLSFLNNTIDGMLYYGQELTPYTVFSLRDPGEPFTIYIGAYSRPESIWIDDSDRFVVKGVFYDCIPIHSNTIIDRFTISPELPQALFIDTARYCIGGLYSDSLYGMQSYYIDGSNDKGRTSSMITLIYTPTIPLGLHSEYFAIAKDYEDVIQYDQHIDYSYLSSQKKGRIFNLNYTSTDLTSPFFTYGISSLPMMYAIFTGYFYFSDAATYSFRFSYESEQDKVLSPHFLTDRNERIIDTWIISPDNTASYFEMLQTFHVHQVGYFSVQIEWLSKCQKTRSIHFEWKKLESAGYSVMEASSLCAPMNNVFEYNEIITTCRLNKYFSNSAILDDKLIGEITAVMGCSKPDASITFDTSDWLPQGLSLDPHEGLISGYPTSPIGNGRGNISVTIKCNDHSAYFFTEIGISVVGMVPPTSSIEYLQNGTVVSSVSAAVLEPILLVPQTETDYFYYDVTPPLPQFITLNPKTGVISGTPVFPLKSTKYMIRGHSTISVVNCELTLEFISPANGTMVGGSFISKCGKVEIKDSMGTLLTAEIVDETVLGIVEVDVYTVTLTKIQSFDWISQDGTQIAINGTIFLPAEMVKRSDSLVSFTVNQTVITKPCISSPSKNYTFYAGVSFPSIDIFVCQPHYPITFSPSLPNTVQLIPRNDGLAGYWLTGVWSTDETVELVISARNNRGNDNFHIRLEVLPMPSLHNQLFVIDTCESVFPPNITISRGKEIVFRRHDFHSSVNRIAVTDVYSGEFLVTVCNSKMDGLLRSFSVFIFIETTTLVFSTTVASVEGCQVHSFHVITFLNPDTLWRYCVVDGLIPTEWKEIDFNDSFWSLKRSQFTVPQRHILYLRNSFEVSIFETALVVHFSFLLREGLILYLNGLEVARYNMGYSSWGLINATSMEPFSKTITISVSSSYLHNGTNVIAVEVHRHAFSSSTMEFSMTTLLIGTEMMHEVRPFPIVTASHDIENAPYVINNADNVHYFWSGKSNDYIDYYHPFSAQAFANGVRITRGENCFPTSVEILGILSDVEEGGVTESKMIQLLEYDHLNWEHKRYLEFRFEGQYSSYRGYRLRFANTATVTQCVHLSSVSFYASKDLHCLWGVDELEVGDAVRFPCENSYQGVQVSECVLSEDRAVWATPTRYCEPMKAPTNRGIIWLTVALSGLHVDKKETAGEVVKNVLSEKLLVKPWNVDLYYVYSRYGTGLFLYKEFYVKITVVAFRGNTTYNLLKENTQLIAKTLTEQLNHEVSVKLKDFAFVVDQRITIILIIAIPIVLLVIVVCVLIIVMKKRQRDKQERLLLLA